MKKLRDVFDVLFGIAKRKDEMGDEPTPAANASIKLGASTTKINAGEELEIRATASKEMGLMPKDPVNLKLKILQLLSSQFRMLMVVQKMTFLLISKMELQPQRLKESVKERQMSSQHQKLMRGILLTN
jgi:hypothetical protein